ncbi:hypothetical protein L596_028640 [Steinernema carpocapsae]|uniref:Uncharacterized protein n=1 Tax=Steinernema carpocapsae TaxID=34508 RepID=A0A4U5LYZ7_STECR|nr:hypothetical protein L596_028640 [Steinernema carpocapsae]
MDVTPTPKHRGRFDSLSEEFPLPAPSPDFGLQPLAEYTGTGPDWMKIYRQELEEEAKREAEEDLAKALENQKLEDA